MSILAQELPLLHDKTLQKLLNPAESGDSFTAEDLLHINSQDEQRYELVEGKLIPMAPAGFEHGDIAMSLGARMRIYADDHGLGIVAAAETGFTIEVNPDTTRAPDVGFVRSERLSPGMRPSGYFPGAPDLAVEVVSPGDKASNVQGKIQEWLSHGTQLVWLVEPQTRTVTVYRSDGSAQVLHGGDLLDGEDVFPGFQYPVERIFG